MRTFQFISLILLPAILGSCSGGDKPAPDVSGEKDSSLTQRVKKGFQGIYDVPEMLCLSIRDSASINEMPQHLRNNYAILNEELELTGAEQDGPMGQISYNNDTTNFVFESLMLIKQVPAIKPVKSAVHVLEASKMLIYDHFGAYENLYQSYDIIRKIMIVEQVEQTGPMREFYITDPETRDDPSLWQTRIMVPVRHSR